MVPGATMFLSPTVTDALSRYLPRCDMYCVFHSKNKFSDKYLPRRTLQAFFSNRFKERAVTWFLRLNISSDSENCDKNGILMVDDESNPVGRTGRWFGIEHWAVEPDILCTSKARRLACR